MINVKRLCGERGVKIFDEAFKGMLEINNEVVVKKIKLTPELKKFVEEDETFLEESFWLKRIQLRYDSILEDRRKVLWSKIRKELKLQKVNSLRMNPKTMEVEVLGKKNSKKK